MAEPIIIAEIEKNSREVVRISIDEFKGHRLIDIRVFAAWGDDDILKPTKKGVSLKIERLPDLIDALSQAGSRIEGARE